MKLEIHGRYNWKNQRERLVYVGRNHGGRGVWHQFELVSTPGTVWCEVLDEDLDKLEQTVVESEDPLPPNLPEDVEFLATMVGQGYLSIRRIGDEWCALRDFFTTRAIVVGLDIDGLRIRYCYQDPSEAVREFDLYTDNTQPPGGNWIKVKGRSREGEFLDDLNPNWSRS